MSDIKDEIDWEFPGAVTTSGQSNFFWQGNIREWGLLVLVTNAHTRPPAAEKTQGATHNISSDSFANYHDYTVSTP